MTLGVEEEFLLVDPASRRTAPYAQAVRKLVGAIPAGAQVHPELLSTQLEFATGVCHDLAELRAQIVAGRQALAEAARLEGLALVSSGTAVLTHPVPVSEGDRFRRITSMYAKVLQEYQVSGCHVHIGVPDRDTAVAVVNHISPWLPTLLALSANSPYENGQDTGYVSWRMVMQSRLPGSGLTPWFASAADHDQQVGRLVDMGVLVDDTMTFWLARPSPRYPTVEFRVADAVATVDEAVLQAALADGLVRHALAELDTGREAPRIPEQWAAAAVWHAARHGLDGSAVDLRSGRLVRATELVAELAALTGVRVDLPHLNGAARQRQAGNPVAAVDELMELT